MGVYANEPTVFMNQHGRPAGIFVDLLNLVAERERWSVRYVPCELRACLDDLHNGRLDLVPDVPRTPAREAQFDFTAQPIVDTWSEVYRQPSSPIKSVLDLDGKRVAVQRGTVQKDHFMALTRRYGLQVMVVEVDSPDQAFSAVGSKNAEAAITSHLFGSARAPGTVWWIQASCCSQGGCTSPAARTATPTCWPPSTSGRRSGAMGPMRRMRR